MGSVKYTNKLRLPQYGPSDKPTWQGDITSAFAVIDADSSTQDATIAGLQTQIISLQNQVAELNNKVGL